MFTYDTASLNGLFQMQSQGVSSSSASSLPHHHLQQRGAFHPPENRPLRHQPVARRAPQRGHPRRRCLGKRSVAPEIDQDFPLPVFTHLLEGHSAMDKALVCTTANRGSNPDKTKDFFILIKKLVLLSFRVPPPCSLSLSQCLSSQAPA